MRITYLTIVFAFESCLSCLAQDTTRLAASDSSTTQIDVTPYYSYDLNNVTSYVRKIDDKDRLQFASGISIFNVLRGQLPSMTMPAYFNEAGVAGVRTQVFDYIVDSPVIIDGVPLNSSISSYLNLNAFDFSSISAFSNTNALNFISTAGKGAFVLSTKTGKDIQKPMVEFNTFATLGRDGPATSVRKNREWNLAHAIAFSQDFGLIDARVSYTSQKKYPEFGDQPYVHNLRLNAGLVSDGKLEIRLYLDSRFSRSTNKFDSAFVRPLPREITTRDFGVLGNLVARYQIVSWLAVTSQAVFAENFNSSRFMTTKGEVVRRRNNTYRQVNFLIKFDRRISSQIDISGFAGVQHGSQSLRLYSRASDELYGGGPMQERWADRSPVWLAQTSITYGDAFVLSYHRRSGNYQGFYVPEKRMTASSISGAIILSELVKMPLSQAKIRASLGEQEDADYTSYPIIEVLSSPTSFRNQKPFELDNLEAGIDIGMVHNKLLISTNYFRNQRSDNATSTKQYGWEADVRWRTIFRGDMRLESGMVGSWLRTRVEQFFSGGMTGEPVTRFSVFNKLSFGPVVGSFLIESASYQLGTLGFQRSSFTKLRDVSLGFRLPSSSLDSVMLCFSGRNLVKLGGTGIDAEESYIISAFEKSFSVSLDVTF